MSKLNKNYVPKEVFNHKEYLEFMESKKVRHGKDRTYTPVDFITDEQLKELNEKGLHDLTPYDPTPKEIQEHFDFVLPLLIELQKKYPDDKYLYSLANDDKMSDEMISTDWYRKYGVEKP